MQNLKINSTYTPYWCVVVPVEAEDIVLRDYDKYTVICHSMNTTAGIGKTPTSLIRVNKNAELLGCITSSGMDEGVREIVDENEWLYDPNVDAENEVRCYRDFEDGNKWWQDAHESALSLLQHNQITLTAENKAVVVKQIT